MLRMDRDITDPRLLYFKGFLFVLLAAFAAGLIFIQSPRISTIALLLIVVWASARAYYFAFYVVEHYADPTFRYAGLRSILAYIIQRRSAGRMLKRPTPSGR